MGLFERVWGWLGGRADSTARIADAAPIEGRSGGESRGWFKARWDSVFNPLTLLGDPETDKGMSGRPNPYVIPLADEELRLLFGFNGLARRIVELPATRATRKGWTVPAVPPSEDRRLHTWERVREAMTWSRLYGGAPLLLVTDEDIPSEFARDPARWLAQPLDLARVQRLVALQVFDTFEAQIVAHDRSVRSPGFRGPLMWQVSTDGFFAQVHASRMLWFRGARRSPSEMRGYNRGTRMPDDSVLQAVWDEVRRLTETMQGGAVLAAEIRESVVKISGLAAINSSDQAEVLSDRLRLLARTKSSQGLILLDENDSYENRSNPPTGFQELSQEAKAMLSAVTGIPEVVLFGSTPSGLNTDGESSWEGFRQLVSDYQEQNRENLERLYRVCLAAREGPTNGVVPDEIGLEFAPLDEPSAMQTAELRKTIAETDVAYIGAGVYTAADVARSRFGEEGYSEELLPVAIPEPEPAPAPEPMPEPMPAGGIGADPIGSLVVEPALGVEDARMDAASEGVFVLVPAPDPGAALRGRVEAAIGQYLEPPGSEPHVTVLYVGDGIRPRFELAEIVAVVTDEASDVRGEPLHCPCLRTFPAGEHGVPVVLEFDAWHLAGLHERLLRRLAHRVTARQRRQYRAHVTLGYSASALTPEAEAALLALDVSAYTVPVSTIVVRAGGREVVRVAVGAEPEFE